MVMRGMLSNVIGLTKAYEAHIFGLWDVPRRRVQLLRVFLFCFRFKVQEASVNTTHTRGYYSSALNRVRSRKDLGTCRGLAGCFGLELSGNICCARYLKPAPDTAW